MTQITPIKPGDKIRIVTTPSSKIGRVPSKSKVQRNNDARMRDDEKKGILPAKNQYKLHTIAEIGYPPIGPGALKELILEFYQRTRIVPNVYLTTQSIENRELGVYLKETGFVSVRFFKTDNKDDVGISWWPSYLLKKKILRRFSDREIEILKKPFKMAVDVLIEPNGKLTYKKWIDAIDPQPVGK